MTRKALFMHQWFLMVYLGVLKQDVGLRIGKVLGEQN